MPLAADRQGHGLPRERLAVLLDRRVGLGPVDHRRPRLLRHRRVGRRPPASLHHPGRDPEDAETEVIVGREQYGGRREHHIAFAPRVLGQVFLEFELQGVFVGLELVPVVGGEVHRVLVRDVDARDRDRAVVVHLLD